MAKDLIRHVTPKLSRLEKDQGCQGLERRDWLHAEGHEEAFEGDARVVDLDGGDGFTTTSVCWLLIELSCGCYGL